MNILCPILKDDTLCFIWCLAGTVRHDVILDYIIIILGDESMCKLVEEYGERQKAEGVLETLVSLAKKKLLTYDEAAKEANMSKSEFMKLVQG